MARFDSFVMFAGMRTGSNYLEASLNALPGVRCEGELFNPHFIGKHGQTELLGVDLAAREADPLALLSRLRTQGGLTGFRYFDDHDPRIFDAVMADPLCAKIVLNRNSLESYVSLKIARETGQWRLTDIRRLKQAKVLFDAQEFEAYLESARAFSLRLLRALQISGQTAFHIDYEDLADRKVLVGLAHFLGVAAERAVPDVILIRQNPGTLAEKVVNPAEMEEAVARLDLFNLAHTSVAEPRRASGLPGYVAARGVGLLYMPVKGGPEAAVSDWLARAGDGVERGLTCKTLRQWQRRHLPHRSFTVLRHPLARAHFGFCNRILAGASPDLRRTLFKTHKLALPAPGEAMDAEAHRATFLGFLRFLKLNLAGQTGLRVDSHFASQTAILQGFARVRSPDAVLREDRLTEGLAMLAAEVGTVAHAFHPEADAAPHGLAAIYGKDLEEAARDVYQRDYTGFGFGPWRSEAEA